MCNLNESSPLVKAIALQLMLERDRSMRACDDALAFHFIERLKRLSREKPSDLSVLATLAETP